MAYCELVALKGSNIFAPTSLQLEAAHQEIMDLKTRLDAIQVKYESAEKEIGCYIPQIQDLKLAISELRFAAYAKKGVDELQRVCVSLLKKNEQLKGEKDGLEVLRPSLFLRKTCLLLLLRLPLVK